MPTKPKPDNPQQSKRFMEAAKAAGVDESGERFDKAFAKVAPPKTTGKPR